MQPPPQIILIILCAQKYRDQEYEQLNEATLRNLRTVNCHVAPVRLSKVGNSLSTSTSGVTSIASLRAIRLAAEYYTMARNALWNIYSLQAGLSHNLAPQVRRAGDSWRREL
jgi:hypothetical protein